MRLIATWLADQNHDPERPARLRWENGNVADMAQFKRIINSSISAATPIRDGVEYSYEVADTYDTPQGDMGEREREERERDPFIVTLTSKPPVRINGHEWEVQAWAEDEQRAGQDKSMSRLVVRQHRDGRALVYGIYIFSTLSPVISNCSIRGGELVVPDHGTVVDAIFQVGKWIEEQRPKDHVGRGFRILAHECIANLPAVDI